MVDLGYRTQPMDVLEPACADAPFLQEVLSRSRSHRVLGVEIDANRASRHVRCIQADFLLWETDQRFDLIIGNPPYGIIGDPSHYAIGELVGRKRLYRQRFHTWRGKYNIYGAFIEKALSLLKPHGQLVFIVPSSWCVLDEFAGLRELLVRYDTDVYHLGAVFPGRSVDATVLSCTRGRGVLRLYSGTSELVACYEPYRGEMVRFLSERWRRFESDGVPLGALFRIRFAARSPEFRRYAVHQPLEGYLPVLTGRNLRPNEIDYEHCYSQMWVRREDAARLREFYTVPHLVVAHTKGTRCVAAVDERCYPWREEYHLIPEWRLDLHRLCRYLNSELVNEYLSDVYRNMVPHLTRTMLSRVPVPHHVLYADYDCARCSGCLSPRAGNSTSIGGCR